MILTDDFQAALAIGRSQGMALKDVENQLQRLNNEIALLKSKNSSLSMFIYFKMAPNAIIMVES